MPMRLFMVFLILFVLWGCQDRYRYFCQDPKNFSEKRCQRPDCLFSQDCPDYLVAPVLEKKVAEPQVQQQTQEPPK